MANSHSGRLGPRRVLISGASVAGPALACWLAAAGWEVCVVERSPSLREGGQNVDVRGVGREALRRMGLEDAVRSAGTGETGTEIVDDDGGTVAFFPAGTGDTDGATAQLEILRGELSAVLYRHSADRAEYLFGEQITALEVDGDAVDVHFDHHEPRRFDVVVLAEGLRSHNRPLVVPDDQIDELGLYVGYLTVPRIEADNDRWRILACGQGRVASLRPDNLGTTRVFLNFRSGLRGLDRLDHARVAALLRDTFADVGWEVPRVLDQLDNGSLYFEDIGLARMPTWHSGRVGLLGDAAYCASPMSGLSTTLALTGAYILAGELTAQPDTETAFTRYEQLMRPLVARAQQLPAGALERFHPSTPEEVADFRRAAAERAEGSEAANPPSDTGVLERSAAEAITLPTYSPSVLPAPRTDAA